MDGRCWSRGGEKAWWGVWWDAAYRVRNAQPGRKPGKLFVPQGSLAGRVKEVWERKLWCGHRRCCVCACGQPA